MQSVRKSRALSSSSFLLVRYIGMTVATGLEQVTTATFYGTVTDQTGAVVPGASVTMTSDETGAILTKTSDASGQFVFDFVHIGSYTLRVEAQGFKKYQITGLQFAAAQNVRRTFSLELGTVADTVEVAAGATLLENRSAGAPRRGRSIHSRETP